MTPIRVQQSRRKGFRLPPNTVSVARPSMFGNPFKIDKTILAFERNATAQGCVDKFRHWLETTEKGRAIAKCARDQLRGKNLACYCKPDAPCHADVLLEIANTLPPAEARLNISNIPNECRPACADAAFSNAKAGGNSLHL